MKVVITGGGGFLGRKLARTLLARGKLTGADGAEHEITELSLFDVTHPAPLPGGDNRVHQITGDVADRALMRKLIGPDTMSVFHFAGVVSAGAEADFDLGYRVNLEGTLAVLEACRALPSPIKLVFTSSLATFGGDYTETVGDETPQTPQTSYGVQKAIGEMLVQDYSRKGMLDGRSLRLPTIVVRPGKPNKAASTFASSIIREPLQGSDVICPVTADVRMPVLSPRRTVECFVHAHEVPGFALGKWRSVGLPSISVTVGELVDALGRAGGEDAVKRIKWEPDPVIQKIVATWPGEFTADKAKRLGFPVDRSADELVRYFIEDDLGKPN